METPVLRERGAAGAGSQLGDALRKPDETTAKLRARLSEWQDYTLTGGSAPLLPDSRSTEAARPAVEDGSPSLDGGAPGAGEHRGGTPDPVTQGGAHEQLSQVHRMLEEERERADRLASHLAAEVMRARRERRDADRPSARLPLPVVQREVQSSHLTPAVWAVVILVTAVLCCLLGFLIVR